MSQLRLDPLTGRWVVVSTNRAERPHAFVDLARPAPDGPVKLCPFCPGSEDATPPPLASYDLDGTWQVRVVPNLYPAFQGSAALEVSHIGPVFTQAPATGAHEVVVLSPDHTASWADLSDARAELVMTALRDRVVEHSTHPGLRYSQPIVNTGREAGASMDHPHAQLLAIPFVPREVAYEQAGFARFEGSCLLCTVISAEEKVGHRVLHADDSAVVVCPFWSGMPFEMLVLPRSHAPHLHTADSAALAGVGRALRTALDRLRTAVGPVAYNVVFHSAPYRASGLYHWHVHVVPRLTSHAGFEQGTGVLINIVGPEEAVAQLRA